MTSIADLTPDHPVPVQAWCIQAYRMASRRPPLPDPWRPEQHDDMLVSLHPLLLSLEGVREVRPLLARFGVDLVRLDAPRFATIDSWLSGLGEGRPFIALSLRIQRLDAFWAALLGQVMRLPSRSWGPPRNISVPEKDRAVASAVRDYLVPPDAWQAFVQSGRLTLPRIRHLADQHGLHVSIVLGLLKEINLLDWAQFAREHVGVRDLLPQDPVQAVAA